MKNSKNLSPTALNILRAINQLYVTEDASYFEKHHIDKLPYKREELEKCLQELHDHHYIFWHNRNTKDEYLYILSKAALFNLSSD